MSPGLTEGGSRRDRGGAEGLKPAEDLAVAVAAEEPQRDDEPDHEPARQAGAEGPVQAGVGESFFYMARGIKRGDEVISREYQPFGLERRTFATRVQRNW